MHCGTTPLPKKEKRKERKNCEIHEAFHCRDRHKINKVNKMLLRTFATKWKIPSRTKESATMIPQTIETAHVGVWSSSLPADPPPPPPAIFCRFFQFFLTKTQKKKKQPSIIITIINVLYNCVQIIPRINCEREGRWDDGIFFFFYPLFGLTLFCLSFCHCNRKVYGEDH